MAERSSLMGNSPAGPIAPFVQPSVGGGLRVDAHGALVGWGPDAASPPEARQLTETLAHLVNGLWAESIGLVAPFQAPPEMGR